MFSMETLMEVKRDRYLNKIISFMWDGQVKVITGIHRCGSRSAGKALPYSPSHGIGVAVPQVPF